VLMLAREASFRALGHTPSLRAAAAAGERAYGIGLS